MQGDAKEGAGSGGVDRLAELKSKVDGLAGLLRQLDAARTGARRTRVGVVLVILLVFLGYGWVMISHFMEFKDEQLPELMAQMQSRLLTAESKPAQEFIAMVKRVIPVYRQAAEDELRQAWPGMREEFQTQAETLMDNLSNMGQEAVTGRVGDIAERQKDLVLGEFKDLDEEAQRIVLTNLEIGLREATLNVLEERINDAAARIQAIHEKTLKFLPEGERAPFQRRMRDLWDQVLLHETGGARMIEE